MTYFVERGGYYPAEFAGASAGCGLHFADDVGGELPGVGRSADSRAMSAGLPSAVVAQRLMIPVDSGAAQARWRCVNGAHLVALVRAGATFVDVVKVEREDHQSAA